MEAWGDIPDFNLEVLSAFAYISSISNHSSLCIAVAIQLRNVLAPASCVSESPSQYLINIGRKSEICQRNGIARKNVIEDPNINIAVLLVSFIVPKIRNMKI